jgi:endonuclease YncB( thermonuclease family)
MMKKYAVLTLILALVFLSSCSVLKGGQAPAGNATPDVSLTEAARILTMAVSTQKAMAGTPTLADTLVPTEENSTPTPVFTATPSASAWNIDGTACIPQNTQQDLAIVLKVLDGDTIQVIINGETKIVRYLGIDAPQVKTASIPAQWKSAEALDKNRALVEGKIVTLIKDKTDADSAGRLLRYVLTDTVFVNREMVKTGFAVSMPANPDSACMMVLNDVQNSARTLRLGIWVPTPTTTIGTGPGGGPTYTPTFKKSDH